MFSILSKIVFSLPTNSDWYSDVGSHLKLGGHNLNPLNEVGFTDLPKTPGNCPPCPTISYIPDMLGHCCSDIVVLCYFFLMKCPLFAVFIMPCRLGFVFPLDFYPTYQGSLPESLAQNLKNLCCTISCQTGNEL